MKKEFFKEDKYDNDFREYKYRFNYIPFNYALVVEYVHPVLKEKVSYIYMLMKDYEFIDKHFLDNLHSKLSYEDVDFFVRRITNGFIEPYLELNLKTFLKYKNKAKDGRRK